MSIVPGSKPGPYEIISAIGAGGMGEVYKAKDIRLGRIVAVKKVREQYSKRFKNDAKKLLDEFEKLSQNSYVPLSSIMNICGGMGDMDKALDWMEKAIDMRYSIIMHLPVNPPYRR